MENTNHNFSRPGYEWLVDFQLGKVKQDLTVEFCERWIDPKSRTFDQIGGFDWDIGVYEPATTLNLGVSTDIR